MLRHARIFEIVSRSSVTSSDVTDPSALKATHAARRQVDCFGLLMAEHGIHRPTGVITQKAVQYDRCGHDTGPPCDRQPSQRPRHACDGHLDGVVERFCEACAVARKSEVWVDGHVLSV